MFPSQARFLLRNADDPPGRAAFHYMLGQLFTHPILNALHELSALMKDKTGKR